MNQNINNADNNDVETQDNYEEPRTNEFVMETQKCKGELKDLKRVERCKALSKLMSERKASGKIKKRRTKSYLNRVKETSGVYLAAVLENLVQN